MERTVYVPPGGPPRVSPPSQEIYAAMGAENIVQMLEDFYRELERSWLRPMFADDMVAASRKSAAFFIGLLGGPPLYHQLYGNPAMRARHMPFAIGSKERDQWVACMVLAMEEVGIEEGVRQKLLQNFFQTADFMRNTPD